MITSKRLIPAAITALAFLNGCTSPAAAKTDIQGLALGSTFDQSKVWRDTHNVKCVWGRGENDYTQFCPNSRYEGYEITYTHNIKPQLVEKITYRFCSGDQQTKVLADINSSFGLTYAPDPEFLGQNYGGHYNLFFNRNGNAFVRGEDLNLPGECPPGHSYRVTISDPALEQQDQSAPQHKMLQQDPGVPATPKF